MLSQVDSEVDYHTVKELISLKLTSDKPGIEDLPVEWNVKDFDGQSAHFQIDIEAASKASEGNLQYYDNVSLTFTDADHELTSDKGESIEYGTTLNF